MGIKFNEALRNDIISLKTLKMIPNKCECGHEYELSNSMKTLVCTNKNCKENIVRRVKTFCNKLGLNIETQDIRDITDKINIITPFQLLIIEDAVEHNIVTESDIHDLKDFIQSIKNIKEKEYFLYNIVELCGIKEIEKVAYKIFDGFSSFDEVFDEIESGQIAFINERLGIKSSDSSIISVDIYNKIISLKEELMFAETQLKIKKYDKKILYIAFCDSIIPYVNKSELIDFLNDRYNYKFVVVSNINESTDILVKNFDGNNSKYRAAKIINDRFIAESMNKGEITLSNIGKTKEGELKPLGSRIYIDELINILKRLNTIKWGEQSWPEKDIE